MTPRYFRVRSGRMTPRRFRVRPGPWRFIFAVVGVIALGRWIWNSVDRRPVNPATAAIAPGEYEVRRTRDNGLIEILIDNSTTVPGRWVEVRLLGIELVDGPQAVRKIRELIADQTVRLRFDRRRLDKDGILLAYLYIDEQLLNAELVRQGLAHEETHAADSGPLVRQIKQAEAEARQYGRGLWAGD